MDFVLNENYLMKCEEDKASNLKEIKEMYDLITKHNGKIYIDENLDYKTLASHPKYYAALGIFKHFESVLINAEDFLEKENIFPYVDNYIFIEIMSLCNKYHKNKLITLSKEDEVIDSNYIIKTKELELPIKNLIGIKVLEKYLYENPEPEYICEVFKRAEEKFEHIRFINEAYKTASSREEIYKQFGFKKILQVFVALDMLVYHFLKGNIQDKSEKDIIKDFKVLTGVEFSRESEATMKKYNKERTFKILGKDVTMTYHIKILDNRIYFCYVKDEDKIYIGHAGAHLSTVKYKGN